MRSEGIFKHAAIAFAIAVVFYCGSFAWIQHQRSYKGPWQITFAADGRGRPFLAISQPFLHISEEIVFPAKTTTATNLPATVRFPEAVNQLPFGKMIFQDPTFLPGTVTMTQFGHEIELLPRVLIIDKKEIPWRNGDKIECGPKS